MGFEPEQEGLREALCTLGNGYFATRGAAPEADADEVHYPGTYIAGCFNRLDSQVSDRVLEHESLVNAPNWLCFTLRFEDGEWFDLRRVDILDYRQELELRTGVLTRRVRYVDSEGRRTLVTQRRFVSMRDPHLAGLQTTLLAENWSGTATIRSALDGRVTNSGVKRYRELTTKHLEPVSTSEDDGVIVLSVVTNQSRIGITEASRLRIREDGLTRPTDVTVIEEPGYIAQEVSIELHEGTPITLEKMVSLYTSRDHAVAEPGLDARKTVRRVGDFTEALRQHTLSWDHLWEQCMLDIGEGERAELILQLHIFHLLQTVSPHTIELDAGVPARGLHGEAYRGHIFWDEVFIFPFLNLRLPGITRALLRYRFRRLPEARWAAKEAGYEGAMYPWQSGSDGREESQTYHLNPRSGNWFPDHSHLQRHIGVGIAYNIWLYYQTTGDLDFLAYWGAEMILEIARFLASASTYNRSLDRYEIKKVMGPDEYHEAYPGSDEPGLDNNAYTNVMATWTLIRALEVLELVPDIRRQRLWEKLGLSREELDRWEAISRKMMIPFHDERIISQFEGYGDLAEFDWDGYRERYGDIARLDRILEAEGDSPNNYRLSKQADVLMLFYLLSGDELSELFTRLGYEFDDDLIQRNVEYYTRRTSHGSTLSRVVNAWVLSRLDRRRSWEFFIEALESDVSDVQGGTTPEGIHLGAMAGTVDLVQRCYAGVEARGDVLRLDPQLPNELGRLRFDVRYRGSWLSIEIDDFRARVGRQPGPDRPVSVRLRDEIVELSPGETKEFSLAKRES